MDLALAKIWVYVYLGANGHFTRKSGHVMLFETKSNNLT